MQVTRVMVDANKFASAVADVIAPALHKSDCVRLPIVEIMPSGRIEIIDGYHRIAGMIAAGETTIDCLTCDDAGVLGDASNPERPEQQEIALEAIYAAQ